MLHSLSKARLLGWVYVVTGWVMLQQIQQCPV